MKCPVDNSEMIVVEHRRIELDYCVECSGVWFDSNELDLLLDSLKQDKTQTFCSDLLTPQNVSTRERKRNCPMCRNSMKKTCVGKEPKVLIDSCPRGHGLWFDGGELNQVISQVIEQTQGKPVPQDILSFLGDALPAAKRPDSNSQK
jgi:uncharacterized protein